MKNNTETTHNTKAKPIICIETNEVFTSVNKAAKAIGCNRTLIHQHLKGDIQSAKGKHFRYLSEEEHEEIISVQKESIIKGKGKRTNGNTNAVLCISTGEVFTSMSDAAEHYGVTTGNFSVACRTPNRTVKGKKFCYIKDINNHLHEVSDAIYKANMYDEYMTKEEKRKELVAEMDKWQSEVARLEYELYKAKENLDHAKSALLAFNYQ